MNETILIKSQRNTLLRNLVLVAGICAALAAAIITYNASQEYIRYYRSVSQVSITLKNQYSSGFSYAFAKSGTVKITMIAGILLFLVCMFASYRFTKSYLVVTSKRVYGVTAWGKRVDLPMDSVSAVSTGFCQAVAVSTPSGRVKFFAIKNRDDIFEALSSLLIQRQDRRK